MKIIKKVGKILRLKANTDQISILLEEYKAIREENLETTKLNYTILTLVKGIQVGLIVSIWKLFESKIPLLHFMLLLPLLMGLFGILLWGAETTRRIRTSLYIKDIINRRLKKLIGRVEEIYVEAGKSPQDKNDYIKNLQEPIKDSILAWEEFLRKDNIIDFYNSRKSGLGKIFTAHYNYLFWGSISIILILAVLPAPLSYIFPGSTQIPQSGAVNKDCYCYLFWGAWGFLSLIFVYFVYKQYNIIKLEKSLDINQAEEVSKRKS